MTTPSLRDSWLRRTRNVTGWVAAGSLAGVAIFASLAAQPTHTTTAKPASSSTTPSSTSTANSTASTPTTLQAPTTTPTTSPATTAHATSGGS